MPPEKSSSVALRDQLALIYKDESSARRISGDAGLDLRLVRFGGRAIDDWTSILEEAEKQDCISALLRCVLKEYSKEQKLVSTIYAYCADNNISLEPSESTRHKRIMRTDWDVRPDEWLSLHGFLENPFADNEADRENRKPFFGRYQVEPPLYDVVMGDPFHPRSIVIGTNRGWGKSTYRIVISEACRPKQKGSPILALEYTDFAGLGDVFEGLSSGDVLWYHVASVLRIAIETLVALIAFSDDGDLPRLPIHFVRRLKWFWCEYGTSSRHPSRYYRRLAKTNANATGKTVGNLGQAKFESAWRHRDLSRTLQKTRLWHHPGVQTLANLVDAKPASQRPDQIGLTGLFAQFIEVIQSIGLASLYVLVDRTDEPHSLAGKPEQTCRMLSPLITELPLMEVQDAAFKFFLPIDVAQELTNQPGVRIDRIPFLNPQWTKEKLREMLTLRLSEFSNGAVTSIDQLCEIDSKESIEINLIHAARGIPRNLLRVANQLTIEHCYYNNDKLLIQWQDWEQTRLAIESGHMFTD